RVEGPACLVLDVRLPGLSGLDLQRELTQSGVQIPIIFITGHGSIPMSVGAMKAGAVEFLTKPVRPRDLLAAIRAAIERDRASHRARRYAPTVKRPGRRGTRGQPSPDEAPLVAIVDDDASVRQSTRRLIRSFGYRAEAFGSGEEFLSSPSAAETACLVLDVRMPGMD